MESNKINGFIAILKAELETLNQFQAFFSSNLRVPVDDQGGVGFEKAREIEKWCFDNEIYFFTDYKEYATSHYCGAIFYYEFKTEEDATAFRLKWT